MTEYEKLAPESKLWIFQADREFTDAENRSISYKLTLFVDNWLSHGSLLKASFKLLHNRFIVFIADEEGNRMCGRAVDASVRFIKELELNYHVALLDRNRVAYWKNDKVESSTLDTLERKMEEGEINPETLIFNNLVSTKAEFEKNWMVPFAQSWQNSYKL